jgi:hypothetical protein
MNNEQSIDRALVHHTCQGPFVNLREVGGQTIRKTGRAETDHAEEVLQCVREYRVNQFTLGRVIDTLVHRKRVGHRAPCCCRHSPVRVTSCLCAYHRGQARDTIIWSSRCRSSCGALRPAEVVFRSLRYTVGPSRSLSRGVSPSSLDGLDPTRERELLYRFYCFTILRTCINAHRLSIHTSLVFTFFPTTLAILPNSSSRFLHAKNTIPNSYVFSSRALSPDQYHADNIPPLNTETISDRSNPPGTSTLTETRTRSSMSTVPTKVPIGSNKLSR